MLENLSGIQEVNITFDAVEVTGDFEIVVIFFGSGLVAVTNVNVAGDTAIGGRR